MGVKSTIELTRLQAVSKAADLHQQMERRKIEALYFIMEDGDLEEELERMNDGANKGEGLENYRIVPEGWHLTPEGKHDEDDDQ